MQCYYLQTGSTDPAYNLAFEEYVLKNRRDGDYLILWQNQNAVIVGRNQNALEEVNQKFVNAMGIRVIRRNTGGGAVYHDLGNLNYSFITDFRMGEGTSDSRFTGPVVNALRQLGLDAQATGRNDILVSGKKVSGTAQHRCDGRILHHGTLLFDANTDMLAGSLNPDPTKFQSKSVKSVKSRVGNLRAMLKKDMTLPQFWAHLEIALTDTGLIPTALNSEELAAVGILKAEKYDTWEWNYGASPKFDSCIRHRFSGGLLEIHLSVSQGRIQALQIYGDFLALVPIAGLTEALLGIPYQKESIRQALAPLPLRDYLGSITGDEFVSAILNEA